jgi:hypothetical protein
MAIATPDVGLNFLPSHSGRWIFDEIGLSSLKLGDLPIMDGNVRGSSREVVPKIFNKLKLFGWGQIE